MQRRSFLAGMTGILASGIAPAAIGSGILMPSRKIIVPEPSIQVYSGDEDARRFTRGHIALLSADTLTIDHYGTKLGFLALVTCGVTTMGDVHRMLEAGALVPCAPRR